MKNKGITLISLVITIIILIILSSIGIYLSLGNNGIFTRAKQAKEATNKQEATDIINLKITTAQMNKYAEKQEMPTLKELSEVLKEDSEIAYVTEKSQVASTKYEVGDNPSSIYTKLNDYPYEFEINGQLQLASIDGVKIATSQTDSISVTKLWYSDTLKTSGTIKLCDDIRNYKFLVLNSAIGAMKQQGSLIIMKDNFIIDSSLTDRYELAVYGTRYVNFCFSTYTDITINKSNEIGLISIYGVK